MRLAVSNLAWSRKDDRDALALVQRLGVAGIEVAPTRIADWQELSSPVLGEYRALLASSCLTISSLQAILFGRPELQLLGDAVAFDRLHDHMRFVADMAVMLGCTTLVLGAPRNRQRGLMAPERAWDLARARLRWLGEAVAACGAIIAVEPVPAFYGGDFLTDWRDVLRMVREVGHPNIRVHLDTGCVALAGGSIGAAITASRDYLVHFHAAQPGLGDFTQPADNHWEAASALRAVQYDRWLAIEMQEQAPAPLEAIRDAVEAVQRVYGLA